MAARSKAAPKPRRSGRRPGAAALLRHDNEKRRLDLTAAPGGIPRSDGQAREAAGIARMPRLEGIDPQLATLVDHPPADDRWLYEVKFDGYRILASTGRHIELRSRNHLDWTSKFPTIAEALKAIDAEAIVDGELCYVTEDGLTHFQMLQNVIGRGTGERLDPRRLVYYLFDLLWCDGEDLRTQPLTARKERLKTLMAKLRRASLQFSAHLDGDARVIQAQACELGLEGVIGKKRDGVYREGRGTDWIKLKCNQRQEFVIVGFLPSDARAGFRSLLVASREGERLRYNGKVGTGFNASTIADVARRLKPLIVPKPGFEGAPALRTAVWVQPKLVCEVAYTEMTRDGSLRHPSFQGLRLDKPAKEVVRERPRPVKAVAGKKAEEASVGGVRISHPERVVDAASGVTKLQLAQYHERVRDRFLACAADRPLALVRCPQGNAQECFFQKNRMPGVGPAVATLDVAGKDALAVNSPAGVYELVQFNVIEMHGWGCRMPQHEQPDWIVFDLDPDEGLGFGEVVDAAQELREVLAAMKLKTFVKTTGGKGLHVVVPLKPKAKWPQVSAFARKLAETLAQLQPSRYVATMSKARRKGRIFVDYLRNAPGSTAILPYSPRTKRGMTVAVPVEWTELKGLDPRAFTVREAEHWLKGRRDPWTRLWANAPELPDLQALFGQGRRRR